ncbi:zinc-dependent alcohol dehydrogenase [Metabacillus sediminilitoris]|uniref:Sorbitol dehydrogenase n=1 Tax=Metabacillus sediminilitoris TaxID=2567941 RepID=A0A4S4C0J4_9BACI|nr:zinc-binding dehydrogenase [Metabacillus sediminilitoris]QGQ47781.1 zinc-binding dehydrogenase [Metabacillus sediminilitoris]THF81106.1 sorbitol dehydrogenase [Metabacillus sediminilitoris]
MKTLVVNSDGQLVMKEIPIPKYNSKQALVKTISCGICGTDATIIKSEFKGFPRETYPLMLGHEGVGRVVEIGSEVTSFKVGDIVLLPFNDEDEEQYGSLFSAWGAFSEYGVINDKEAYEEGEIPDVAHAQQIVPDDIDPVDATVLVTLREVYSTIRYFGLNQDDRIVVFGSGPVAVTFIKLMSLMGIQSIGIARSKEKQDILLANGASAAFNSRESDIKKEIRALYPNGVKFVLDAVGAAEIMNQAMELIEDRGEILCYGVPKYNHMQLDWSKAPYNWKLNFQQMPSKLEESESYGQILTWIREGKINLKDFISNYYPFENILDAFKEYMNHQILKKAIITYPSS